MLQVDRSHMYVVTKEAIFYLRVLYLAVSFHIVTPRELLPTDGTLVTLRSVDVGVMPAVGDRLVATHASVQGGKGARQLDKQGGVVNVVITAGRYRSAHDATHRMPATPILAMALGWVAVVLADQVPLMPC